jgi:hypothetical protein
VDIGLITFNVPAEWEVTVVPSDTLELGPFDEGVVIVTVRIPCPVMSAAPCTSKEIYLLQQGAGGVPTIDVEGYIEGQAVGGIELQFQGAVEHPRLLYLPIILRNR